MLKKILICNLSFVFVYIVCLFKLLELLYNVIYLAEIYFSLITDFNILFKHSSLKKASIADNPVAVAYRFGLLENLCKDLYIHLVF